MPLVRIEPLGATFDVTPEETMLVAAWRLGYSWPTLCWGQAECMVCRVKVISGAAEGQPASAYELERMRTLMPRRWQSSSTRLACQLKVTGPGVVLEKAGVKGPV